MGISEKESYSQSADYLAVEEYDDSYARNIAMGEAEYDGDYGGASTASVERKTITTIDMAIEVDDAAASIEEISKLAAASEAMFPVHMSMIPIMIPAPVKQVM
ncbi:MAG: hypothetical protein R2741_05075 [Methanolobus sp.]